MRTRKIYVAGVGNQCYGYSNWLQGTGFVKNIEDCDLVLGLGGSDVSSHYYNQKDSGLLHCNYSTDKLEYRDFKRAIELGKKIVGTCKAAQWASALSGGAIFQHINHPYRHKIKTFDGKELLMNSLHHNMIDLSNLKENEDYSLLGWTENLSPYHINGDKENIECFKEPEVVFFKKTKWLGFQNHNEMLYRNGDKDCQKTIEWSQEILNRFMDDKL
jgi:hypothetical protein